MTAFRILLVPLLLAAAALPASGKGFPVPLGFDALKAELSARVSSVSGAGILLFGPNDLLPDLFLPLHGEGKVGALSVVVPSEGPFTEEDLSSFASYVAAFSPGSDNGFALRDGAIDGKIGGLAVRVHPLGSWRPPPGEGAVVLDVAFLLALYKDEVRTPVPDLPLRFLAMLEERKVDPGRLLPWVGDRRDIPLERGYLPKLLAEVARDPKAFGQGLPPKWQLLRTAEQLAYLGMYEQSVSHFEGYLKDEPEEPSVLYRIALTRFVDQDPERGLRFLLRAYKADPYYIRAYSASGFALYRKGELEPAERVVRAGLHLEPDFLDLRMGLGQILLGQAKNLLPKDLAAAEKRFSETGSLGLPPDLLDRLSGEWEQAKTASPSPGEAPREGIPPGHPAK